MIVDAKVDYKSKKLILIKADGEIEERDLIPPYFYAIIPKGKGEVLKRLVGGEAAWIEPDNKVPIIYTGKDYRPDPRWEVYRIYTESPSVVPRIAQALRDLKIRIAASNVRYVVRNCFDHNIEFFDTTPVYYGFDPMIIENLRRVEALVIDVEAIGGKPVLVSVYRYKPFSEIVQDDVESLWLPNDADRLQQLLNKYPIIIGHNVIGFDIPVLQRAGFVIDTLRKLIFDTSAVLSVYGSSLKVGSARSLLDVATILKEDAGITDEELQIKRGVKGRIDKLNKEELERYNVNDVVITAKLLNIFFPFIAVVAGITGIPTTEVMSLPSGMVAEYFLLRWCELLGYVPEYRPTEVELVGERVWLRSEGTEFPNILQTDVKMMYPTFVLKNFIDPTLYIEDENRFSREKGIGILYSAVLRLAQVRQFSKKLKKENTLYEPLDHGIKSILNALAYGVQGKKSGLAIMGNPWCPSRIFYGTREAQFKTIEYLVKRGIKVVYSDTDSFYISVDCRDQEECKKKIEEIVQTINDYIKQWGLEVDVETPPGRKDLPLWDKIYIYSKKNYILRAGDVVIVKGSALHNLDRIYTPECVSLQTLLKVDSKEERLKLLKEMIDSAPIEDLFVRGHQQIWRLISKDVQSWKRLGEKRERYMRVLTKWQEKPTLVLKKTRGGQLLLAHSNPIFALFLDGSEEVDIEELNPFNIIELRSLRLDGWVGRLKGKYRLGDLLIYTDRMYTLWFEGLWYGVLMKGNRRYIPSHYSGVYPPRPIGLLETIKCKVRIAPVDIEEDLLRKLVFEDVKQTLREYGLL